MTEKTIGDKIKLFRRTLFCWLSDNEDMHLKNFSLIHREEKVELSPAYDLLNTTTILANPAEEMALPLHGKKSNFNQEVFLDYFGKGRLNLNEKVMGNIRKELTQAFSKWERLIKISFLNDEIKEAYIGVLKQKRQILGW